MSNTLKTKSRTKLYNAIGGGKEIVGAAGTPGNWTILLNTAAAGDTVQVGPYYFEFALDGAEDAPLASAGTAADPHVITNGATPNTTEAAASLAAALLAETATTGKWGYLHPVNATGASSSTATVTINFWPSTFPNAATYIPDVTFTGTDPTITKVTAGVSAPSISPLHNVTIIDTTGSTNVKEYYSLADGSAIGQQVTVLVATSDGSDTPTVMGHLSDAGVAQVEALWSAGVDGTSSTFLWTGSAWEQINENGTAVTFDAAA